jgi:hypothetical protein
LVGGEKDSVDAFLDFAKIFLQVQKLKKFLSKVMKEGLKIEDFSRAFLLLSYPRSLSQGSPF